MYWYLRTRGWGKLARAELLSYVPVHKTFPRHQRPRSLPSPPRPIHRDKRLDEFTMRCLPRRRRSEGAS